jgi:hypothetical protein
VSAFLDAVDLLPPGFTIGEIPAAQTHLSATTVLVALAAGSRECWRSRRGRSMRDPRSPSSP